MASASRPLFLDHPLYQPRNGTVWIWLGLCVLFSFFVALGSVPLFDLDEGAFSEATREMLLRGDYISTFLNGEPRYDKPVLIYWLQAVSVLVFGVNEFAFRLPSALCATAWVAFVFFFIRRLRGAQNALVVAGMTATAAGITVIGRAAIADALLNMLIVASMCSAYLYLIEQKKFWLRCAFVAIGFGLLAKGPIAILIPVAVTFLYCALNGRLALWFKSVFDVPGILLMLAIAAPWYGAQYYKEGDAFVRGFLLKHNVERFGAPMHGFNGSVLFYVPWLLIATLPFTAPLLKVFASLRVIWTDDLQRYGFIWFAFVFIFFSLSGTKLPHYVFYGYSGLFIVMGLQVEHLKSHALALLPAALVFLLFLALPYLLTQRAASIPDAYYREAFADIQSHFGWPYYAVCGLAAIFTLVMMFDRRFELGRKLLACGIMLSICLSLFILPAAGAAQQQPIKEAALLARQKNLDVVMWGLNTPSFIVYSGKLVARRDPRAGEVVLTKTKHLAQLKGYEVLYQRNGIALVKLGSTAP